MTCIARSKIRLLALTLCSTVLVSSPSGAELIAPYTSRIERQDDRLQVERQLLEIDFAIPNRIDLTISTNVPQAQAIALLCELEAQKRGLEDPAPGWVELTDEVASSQLKLILEGLFEIIAGYVGDNITEKHKNIGAHQAGNTAMLAAYILQRFPNAAASDPGTGWSTDVTDYAEDLFRRGEWDLPYALEPGEKSINPLSNNQLSYINMALFAAEVFDDETWWTQVRWQFQQAQAIVARRGLSEVLAAHYSGRVVMQLMLARETNDAALKMLITDLLEILLVANGHTYLPGGGLGAPQSRSKPEGGIIDPTPVLGGGGDFIQKVNMVIYDPELEAKFTNSMSRHTYDARILATDYEVPEVIRSIYLHKGDDGYLMRFLGLATWDNGAACCPKDANGYRFPLKTYDSTVRSWNPSDWLGTHGQSPQSDSNGQTNLSMQPGYAAMLPSGKAMIGGAYAYHAAEAVSWGAYIENPSLTETVVGYSILYHYQPKHDLDVEPTAPWDPLVEDPKMKYERKSYVRMGHHRTQLALYDVVYDADPGEDPDLEYTVAHLPDFMTKCDDDDWWVGQAVTNEFAGAGGPYVAYYPIGSYTQEELSGVNGDFTYLTLDGDVSGYMAEIAEGSDYDFRGDYCTALHARTLNTTTSLLDPASAYVETQAPNSLGNLEVIRLEYAPEKRFIGGSEQTELQVFGTGRIDSPWVTWDETEFTLTIARDLDGMNGISGDFPETHTLEFGDPLMPTAPGLHRVEDRDELDDPVKLIWDHGWDDFGGGIEKYLVFRNGLQIAEVDAAISPGVFDDGVNYTDSALCTNANITDTASYQIRSVDLAGNSPVATDENGTVYVDGKKLYVDTPLYEVEIEGDVSGAAAPGKPSFSVVGGNVVLWWTAAIDNYAIWRYVVFRTNVNNPNDSVFMLTPNASTWIVDQTAVAGETYTYYVNSIDACFLWGQKGEESEDVSLP